MRFDSKKPTTLAVGVCQSNPNRLLNQGTPQSYSEAAVKVADALIEELKKK